jgi:hypothetical protein
MTVEQLFELYKKEREYQIKIFGRYEQNPALNVASFLNFVEEYLKKAKESYVYDWTHKRPDWFVSSSEFWNNGQATAPVKTYEHLIKVFALAGATLESFLEVKPDEWRKEGPKEKWLKEK